MLEELKIRKLALFKVWRIILLRVVNLLSISYWRNRTDKIFFYRGSDLFWIKKSENRSRYGPLQNKPPVLWLQDWKYERISIWIRNFIFFVFCKFLMHHILVHIYFQTNIFEIESWMRSKSGLFRYFSDSKSGYTK